MTRALRIILIALLSGVAFALGLAIVQLCVAEWYR